MTNVWKITAIFSVVLLLVVTIVLATFTLLNIRDALVLNKAISAAVGLSAPAPSFNDLDLPTLPPVQFQIHAPFTTLAADLITRLYTHIPTVQPLTTISFLHSTSGVNNVWIAKNDAAKHLWFVFRGTASNEEWSKNFNFKQVSLFVPGTHFTYPALMDSSTKLLSDNIQNIQVHSGFCDIFTSLQPELTKHISAYLEFNICITGHSLGAAVAQLSLLHVEIGRAHV